jgi:tetratricopeptide (TPR) repeat protein
MKTVLFLMLWLAGISLAAQTSSRNDEMKLEADYLLMLKDYGKALDLYLKIVRTEPENADIKHRIGICYLNSEDDKEKAIAYLEEAVQKVSAKYNPNSLNEENASFEAYFTLGSAYRVNNDLDKAIEAYTKFKEYVDPNDEYNIRVADQYIHSCNLARHMLQHPVLLESNNLGGVVNNEKPNFNAVVSGDGRLLLYTSPGRQGYEIFQAVRSDTGWTVPKNITSVLGTGKYMKTCDLSYDGLTLLLALEDPENSDVFISHFNKGRWSKVEPLGKNINGKSQETHASLSFDNTVLYFTSNRKGGEGDLDIYKSVLDSKGEWGKAVNLGPEVNTPFNEETPFVTDDDQVLYFSSEGHDGIGGYDVFRYDLKSFGSVTENLGYPVNTTDNNLFYYPADNGKSAYYAFTGENTFGARDIYQVTVKEAPPEPEMLALAEPEAPEVVPVDPANTVDSTTLMAVAEPQVTAPVVMAAVAELPQETVSAVTEEPAEVPAEVPEEVPENVIAEAPENVTAEVPVNPVVYTPADAGTGSYTIQIMALRKPVDLNRFRGLSGLAVAYNSDRWYRYTLGSTTQEQEASRILTDLIAKGYRDAFIRRKNVIPLFTIQVMAVPGPVVDLSAFGNLSEISARKGVDSFCRYTTGEFETFEDARAGLQKVRESGYPKAFVTRIKTPQ